MTTYYPIPTTEAEALEAFQRFSPEIQPGDSAGTRADLPSLDRAGLHTV